MLITETQTVKQFSDESEFESTLSFSLDTDDVEDWVVVENDAQELSLSLTNWKKLVEMGNKIIISIENSKIEKGILDNLNSKQLDGLEVILKKNRKLYSEEEVLQIIKNAFNQGERYGWDTQASIDNIDEMRSKIPFISLEKYLETFKNK